MMQDLRYALRVLARSPGFTAVAILTLAVGIGADTAMFSVVNGVLLRALPYPEPDRLVRIFEEAPDTPKFPVAPGNFRDYRADVRAFDAVAAYERSDLQLSEGDRPEHLRAMRVTPGFFALLGARPILGREFEPQEELPDSAGVVVLSHALWQRRFGSDPTIVGRMLVLSGESYRVVGVLPSDFQHVGSSYRLYGHGAPVDVWWVRSVRANQPPRNQHYLNVVARLRSGVTQAQAQQELTATSTRLAHDYPATNARWTARIVDLKQEILGTSQPTIVILAGAVQLVLLLACANVAGLMLGRPASRSKEIGVRAALGATSTRLARQLLVESVVIATLGGVAGLALAIALVRALAVFGPADIPRLQMITVDPWTVVYAFGAAMVTALVFGLAPAWQLANSSLAGAIKLAGRGSVGGGHQRLRRFVVASEVALAFVLVVTAGLLLRSFIKLVRVDPGFRAEHVLTAGVNLPYVRYDDEAAAVFYNRLLDRLAAIPAVRAAGLGSALPWTGYDENTSFGIAGRTFPPNEGPEARYHAVTSGFFDALSIPRVAGRDVAAGDTSTAPLVVVVNDALASKYFANAQAAIGARINLWGSSRTIVGVFGSVKDEPWSTAAGPAVFFPKSQQTVGGDMLLALRVDGDPSSVAGPLQAALRDLDPALPLARVQALDQVAAGAFASRRFTLGGVVAFGLTALFLAAVGIYGVMAQTVGQRAQELSVRQALGATPRDVLQLVMTAGATLSAIGLVVGIALAAITTRLLGSLLFGVQPLDPVTFGAVALVLLAVALLASYLPARRAMRIDPVTALRQ